MSALLAVLLVYLSVSTTLQNQMLGHHSVKNEPCPNPDPEGFPSAERCLSNENCPPWMTCENKTTHTCQCRKTNVYHDIVKCDSKSGRLSILDCYCATYNNATGRIIAGACIENCMNTKKTVDPVYHQLPVNLSTWNEYVCGKDFNRGGRLCGKCLPGYSPLAYSFNMTCVNCTNGNQNIWKYLLIAFVPLTLFYYFILFFKVNATSSHLHGFIIFSQAISTSAFCRIMLLSIKQETHLSMVVTEKILLSFYGFWNLDFFRMLIPGICLDLSMPSILALDYAVAAYPILLTILSYILIKLHDQNFKLVVCIWRPFQCLFTRFRRNWDIRTSIIDAYATFCLLSFCKIVSTSFDLLIPTYAYDLGGTDDPKLVLYYDGTIEYFGPEHLPYAILAIIISLVFAVLPMLLMLIYPCRCFQFLLNRCHVRGHVLHTFMDAFQGCYKDGTEPGTRDCRWFAGLYLLLRILMLSVFSFTLNSLFLPFGIIILLLVLIVIINVQPNKTTVAHYNKINVTFISFLVLYYTALNSVDISTIKNHFFVKGCYILSSLVGITPLIYMSCFCIYWFVSRRRWGIEFVGRVRQWLSGNMEERLSVDQHLDVESPDSDAEPENNNNSNGSSSTH